MPTKSPAIEKKEQEKRKLVDALEALRGHSPTVELAGCKSDASNRADIEGNIPEDINHVKMQLKSFKATCELLEEENRTLEKKALFAIAEAGKLRMCLDRIDQERKFFRSSNTDGGAESLVDERENLHECIKSAEIERTLLTRAISDSESEIARLSKTIDLLVKKISILAD
ncbi:MAG: hypothetical protein JXR97_14600 [Planctomycetes bacterium]|nr:hypothetical protein [Planctomycetota bacterium]